MYKRQAHDSIHLAELTTGFAALHGFCQHVAKLVELCRLSALTGNNKRRSGLVDQNRVYLIDDRVMQLSLNQLLLVDDHVVTQIIKSKLIIRHIGDVTGIGCPALIACAAIEHHAHGQSQLSLIHI